MLFRDRAIIRLEEVDSTNNYAANLIKLSVPPEGTVITAQYQTVGKGQRGATWESNSAENLLCSIILYPRFLQGGYHFFLSQAISLALQELLEVHTAEDVFIKWPNDIIIRDKKVAGILIETTWANSRLQNAIAGIGINLNQDGFSLPGAISVRQLTGKTWDIDDCLLTLLELTEKYYLRLHTGQFSEISAQYREHLYRRGQLSRFIYGGKELVATIRGVDRDGRLQLDTEDGTVLTCSLREIAMVY
jgi:BirA family transcriptional regulator, biotin operon repressor / biotin---[acetyl-CoA-carboxylase] ligase